MDAGEPTLSVLAAPVVAQPERFWLSTGSHRTQERERGRERKRAQIFIQSLKAKRVADVSFAQSKWRIIGINLFLFQ